MFKNLSVAVVFCLLGVFTTVSSAANAPLITVKKSGANKDSVSFAGVKAGGVNSRLFYTDFAE